MSHEKERDVSFSEEAKETIQDRLVLLFKGRSRREMSTLWGLPYSTLNNYFSKGSSPGLDVIVKIAAIEKVSVDWLVTGGEAATGADESVSSDHKQTISDGSKEIKSETLRNSWLSIFDYVNEDEAEAFIRLVYRDGIRGIIHKLTDTVDATWHDLPEDEKQRLMQLHEAKKGASQTGGNPEGGSLKEGEKKVS